ncbi:hypothetical protein SLOPH_765 [Spraguea lophii 42_110]|uniref:Uncharacterized protein n=1 Tax=Spraguea lophii (strain 42_110) TaxID=1358809 RepID=S7XKC2_SPRLO|nr:hypothetical protein SLOPH_765 [Spraguea lophii 42_110]
MTEKTSVELTKYEKMHIWCSTHKQAIKTTLRLILVLILFVLLFRISSIVYAAYKIYRGMIKLDFLDIDDKSDDLIRFKLSIDVSAPLDIIFKNVNLHVYDETEESKRFALQVNTGDFRMKKWEKMKVENTLKIGNATAKNLSNMVHNTKKSCLKLEFNCLPRFFGIRYFAIPINITKEIPLNGSSDKQMFRVLDGQYSKDSEGNDIYEIKIQLNKDTLPNSLTIKLSSYKFNIKIGDLVIPVLIEETHIDSKADFVEVTLIFLLNDERTLGNINKILKDMFNGIGIDNVEIIDIEGTDSKHIEALEKIFRSYKFYMKRNTQTAGAKEINMEVCNLKDCTYIRTMIGKGYTSDFIIQTLKVMDFPVLNFIISAEGYKNNIGNLELRIAVEDEIMVMFVKVYELKQEIIYAMYNDGNDIRIESKKERCSFFDSIFESFYVDVGMDGIKSNVLESGKRKRQKTFEFIHDFEENDNTLRMKTRIEKSNYEEEPQRRILLKNLMGTLNVFGLTFDIHVNDIELNFYEKYYVFNKIDITTDVEYNDAIRDSINKYRDSVIEKSLLEKNENKICDNDQDNNALEDVDTGIIKPFVPILTISNNEFKFSRKGAGRQSLVEMAFDMINRIALHLISIENAKKLNIRASENKDAIKLQDSLIKNTFNAPDTSFYLGIIGNNKTETRFLLFDIHKTNVDIGYNTTNNIYFIAPDAYGQVTLNETPSDLEMLTFLYKEDETRVFSKILSSILSLIIVGKKKCTKNEGDIIVNIVEQSNKYNVDVTLPCSSYGIVAHDISNPETRNTLPVKVRPENISTTVNFPEIAINLPIGDSNVDIKLTETFFSFINPKKNEKNNILGVQNKKLLEAEINIEKNNEGGNTPFSINVGDKCFRGEEKNNEDGKNVDSSFLGDIMKEAIVEIKNMKKEEDDKFSFFIYGQAPSNTKLGIAFDLFSILELQYPPKRIVVVGGFSHKIGINDVLFPSNKFEIDCRFSDIVLEKINNGNDILFKLKILVNNINYVVDENEPTIKNKKEESSFFLVTFIKYLKESVFSVMEKAAALKKLWIQQDGDYYQLIYPYAEWIKNLKFNTIDINSNGESFISVGVTEGNFIIGCRVKKCKNTTIMLHQRMGENDESNINNNRKDDSLVMIKFNTNKNIFNYLNENMWNHSYVFKSARFFMTAYELFISRKKKDEDI